MRTNFYELLAKRSFDAKEEYASLWYLFDEEKSVKIGYSSISLSEYINKNYFRSLPFRGTFTDLNCMMRAIGLVKCAAVNIEKLLLFCEFLVAVIPEALAEGNSCVGKQRKTLIGNIDCILEQTDHEIVSDADDRPIIVAKNNSAKLAAEIVADGIVSFELIEYNHFALKGHLEEKKRILASLAAYIEPILKSRALSKAGYKQLESDTGFVFNNFHIRHNNKEGPKAQDYIVSAADDELEKWYDHAYELAVSVIIINDYLTTGKEIEEIKAAYTWRT